MKGTGCHKVPGVNESMEKHEWGEIKIEEVPIRCCGKRLCLGERGGDSSSGGRKLRAGPGMERMKA